VLQKLHTIIYSSLYGKENSLCGCW